MKKEWKTYAAADGMVVVVFGDGTAEVVSNNGVTGYGFALEYLERLKSRYSNHLLAADLILQQQLGSTYRHVRKMPHLYQSNLAVVSMLCAKPQCDSSGELTFRYGECPIRAVCPFNGYRENSDKRLVCCNPIFETNLTPRQKEVADLLLNTGLDLSDVAELLRISKEQARFLASKVYAEFGLSSRQGLMLFLKGKRIV